MDNEFSDEAGEILEHCRRALLGEEGAMGAEEIYGLIMGAHDTAYLIAYNSPLAGVAIFTSVSGAGWVGEPIPLRPGPGTGELGELARYEKDTRDSLRSVGHFKTKPERIQWDVFDAIVRALKERGDPG